MDNFRTEIQIAPSHNKFGLKDPIFCLGSCFAEVMGRKLVDFKFDGLVNPFGTLFNPLSLLKLLEHSFTQATIPENNVTQRNDYYYHFDLHSSFYGTTREMLIEKINTAINQSHNHLIRANWLILTLGTAHVYKKKDDGAIVANCHKMPQQLFEKQLLTVPKIIDAFSSFLKHYLNSNPDTKIILTVSPVRHTRDSLTNNSVSKATLRVACEQLRQKFPANIFYFPAYEIMMDDLRDYRFYQEDMIHPSKAAEDYIWKKFIETYADDESLKFIRDWNKISKALNHKPFHTESEEYQRFLRKTIDEINKWAETVNVSDELARLKNQLI